MPETVHRSAFQLLQIDAPILTQATIIPWVFASRTCAIKVYLTNSADVVVWNIPSPRSYRIPFPDLDLHRSEFVYMSIDCSDSFMMDFQLLRADSPLRDAIVDFRDSNVDFKSRLSRLVDVSSSTSRAKNFLSSNHLHKPTSVHPAPTPHQLSRRLSLLGRSHFLSTSTASRQISHSSSTPQLQLTLCAPDNGLIP